MIPRRFNFIIVGGGLAGLMAAERAEARGCTVALIDSGIPEQEKGLGGFAPFSGAKFSLYPAGTGLAPLVGGDEALIERYGQLCAEFAGLGFSQFAVSADEVSGRNQELSDELTYREYHSVLLSPAQMAAFLRRLTDRLDTTHVIHGSVERLVQDGETHVVLMRTGETLSADKIILAAGRLGSHLLKDAGAREMPGKGIDVGVRIGFASSLPLDNLRRLGPDAKFMSGDVRTFCLNSPGRIFHYRALGYEVPGGIVAEPESLEANVGVLCRLSDRGATLGRLASEAPGHAATPLAQQGKGLDLGWNERSRSILGPHVVAQIDIFMRKLSASGLVTLPEAYQVHYPLLDWHWPVFSDRGRLETSISGVFASGDVSGHARGLMQAALMGVLAVEEAVS